MREIKYKAFERGSDNVLYWCSDDGDNGFWELVGIFHQQYDLVEYTGLKDKNGVEIYEGDILKYPYVRSSSVNYTIEIGVIEWSGEYCGFIIDEVQNIGGFCGIESKHMNELEVIGNIYKNPELL